MTDEDPAMSADGKFQPNVINSAVFLLAAVMQVKCLHDFSSIPLLHSTPSNPLQVVLAITARYTLSVPLCLTLVALDIPRLGTNMSSSLLFGG